MANIPRSQSLLRSPKGRPEGAESDQNMENKLSSDQGEGSY